MKKKTSHKRIKFIVLYSASWLSYFALMFTVVTLFENMAMGVKIGAVLTLGGLFPVHTHLYVLHKYFENRKYLHYGISVIIILGISEPLTQMIHRLIDNDPNSHVSGIGLAILYMTFTAGLQYFARGIKQQYRLQEAEHKQVQTELSLLKSQINPHFFFNTLNNLYALSLDQSNQVPCVILKLSDLMRYVLDGSQKETVPLKDEMAFLQNYIDLERLRLNRGANIQIEINDDFNEYKIAPMILVPFVENAFKHGLNASKTSGHLYLTVSLDNNNLQFHLENSTPAMPVKTSEDSPQMGLANVKRRLELLYPNRYNLSINNGDRKYQVDLRMQL
ncbi:histidine kinase [bacterium]|nr:histidine kinase [bacterium]